MARELKHVQFYNLEVGQQVIVEDGIEMKPARIMEIGGGPGGMFCSVLVDGDQKQVYFEKIYYTP